MIPIFQCGNYVCPNSPTAETAHGLYHPTISDPVEESGHQHEQQQQQQQHQQQQQQQQQHHLQRTPEQQHQEPSALVPNDNDMDESTTPEQREDDRFLGPLKYSHEHEVEIELQMKKFLQHVSLRAEKMRQVVEEEQEHEGSTEDPCQAHEQDDKDPLDGYEMKQVDTSFDESPIMSMETKELPEKDIDLAFVEEYDHAFHEFLTRHPRFLIANPNLIHHIRVIKLQKLLEAQNRLESSIQDQLEKIINHKRTSELGWQEQLRDAAGKKAARETHLQSYLSNVHYATKCMEAQWTWHIVCDTQHCIKKEHLLKRNLQEKHVGDTLEDLLLALPEGSDFDDVRNAMLAPAGQSLSEEQEKDLRQFQTDNAFLAAEVAVLKKKLAYQKATTKRHAWVESVLLRMDERSVRKLKNRFHRKVGVPV